MLNQWAHVRMRRVSSQAPHRYTIDTSGREPIVTVPFPPSAPRGPCALCGAEVVIAPLPTGRTIAVDPATHEPLDALCQKRRP